MTSGVLLLAAGQSRRFGTADKLLADLEGTPLVTHAARALSGAKLDLRLAVVTSQDVAAVLQDIGFTPLMTTPGPQSASITAGVTALQNLGATRIVIALGDMPLIAQSDIENLLAMPVDQPASAWLENAPRPPAIFPASWFKRLTELTGDRGAGALLRDLPTKARLAVPAERLRDIDTTENLQMLRASMRSR